MSQDLQDDVVSSATSPSTAADTPAWVSDSAARSFRNPANDSNSPSRADGTGWNLKGSARNPTAAGLPGSGTFRSAEYQPTSALRTVRLIHQGLSRNPEEPENPAYARAARRTGTSTQLGQPVLDDLTLAESNGRSRPHRAAAAKCDGDVGPSESADACAR